MLTKEVGHHELLGERFFRTHSNERLRSSQSIKSQCLAILGPPLDLSFNVVEQGDRIAKAVLHVDVTKSQRDQQDF